MPEWQKPTVTHDSRLRRVASRSREVSRRERLTPSLVVRTLVRVIRVTPSRCTEALVLSRDLLSALWPHTTRPGLRREFPPSGRVPPNVPIYLCRPSAPERPICSLLSGVIIVSLLSGHIAVRIYRLVNCHLS